MKYFIFKFEDIPIGIYHLPNQMGGVITKTDSIAVQPVKQHLPHIWASSDIPHHRTVFPTETDIIFLRFLQKFLRQFHTGIRAFFRHKTGSCKSILCHPGRTHDFFNAYRTRKANTLFQRFLMLPRFLFILAQEIAAVYHRFNLHFPFAQNIFKHLTVHCNCRAHIQFMDIICRSPSCNRFQIRHPNAGQAIGQKAHSHLIPSYFFLFLKLFSKFIQAVFKVLSYAPFRKTPKPYPESAEYTAPAQNSAPADALS